MARITLKMLVAKIEEAQKQTMVESIIFLADNLEVKDS